MAQKVRDIMTKDPECLPSSASVFEAAKLMREKNIGDIIVQDSGEICGIVTDRDVVVRAVATGEDLTETPIADICSRDLATVSPDDDVTTAVKLMHERAVRRVPVVEAQRPVGILSIGDLAIERDRTSALGDISAAPPNR